VISFLGHPVQVLQISTQKTNRSTVSYVTSGYCRISRYNEITGIEITQETNRDMFTIPNECLASDSYASCSEEKFSPVKIST